MDKLKNKVAVITGGSSGISLATAKEFIANKAKVAIFGRGKQALDKASSELSSNSYAVLSVALGAISLRLREGMRILNINYWVF